MSGISERDARSTDASKDAAFRSDDTSPDGGLLDSPSGPGREVPEAPPGAVHVFGARLPLAERFTAILADSGVAHGLIGPREVPRLWERHVLNCAVIHPSIAEGDMVIDVGSGAGLPGVALAIARPDLDCHLVEPMLRRTNWLSMVVAELGLPNVTVHRGRAEQFWGVLTAPVVTARAVAPLAQLASWCLPLLQPGGSLLAIRGLSVAEEVEAARMVLWGLGAVDEVIEKFGRGIVDQETTVLRVRVGISPAKGSTAKKKKSKRKRRV